MRVLTIVETIVDGPHLRTSVYFAGCKHYCKGCHNKDSWDLNGGTENTPSSILDKIDELGNKYVTLSGGDPFYQPIDELLHLLIALKANKYNIWLYTGYVYEYIPNIYNECLKYIDVIVDGPFIQNLKDANLEFRGSSNQRLINVQESIRQNKTIIIHEIYQK